MSTALAKNPYAWYLLDERTWVDAHNQTHDIYRMKPRYLRNVLAFIERIPRETLENTIYGRYFSGPVAESGFDADVIFDEVMGGDQWPTRTDAQQRAYIYPCYDAMVVLVRKREKTAERRRNENRRRRRQKRGW